jgi:hypothetical protein
MSELRERMLVLMAEVEKKAEGKSIAEQEMLVIEFGEQIQRMMMQEMVRKGEGVGGEPKKRMPEVQKEVEWAAQPWGEGGEFVGGGGTPAVSLSLRVRVSGPGIWGWECGREWLPAAVPAAYTWRDDAGLLPRGRGLAGGVGSEGEQEPATGAGDKA